MSILSELKSLTPQQRLIGFVMNIIITAVVSISIAYLNSNDCTSVNKKYEETLKNYSQMVDINNQLMTQLNQAKKDILVIYDILNKDVTEKTYSRITKVEEPKNNGAMALKSSPSDSFFVFREPQKDTVKIKEIITISQVPKDVIKAQDSILSITEKYKN